MASAGESNDVIIEVEGHWDVVLYVKDTTRFDRSKDMKKDAEVWQTGGANVIGFIGPYLECQVKFVTPFTHQLCLYK